MPLRRELVAAGEMLTESLAVGGSFDLGVTLTTGMTNQATAYVATKANTVVTTSGASGNALMLMPADQGDWIQVANFTANAVTVFPPVGWAIHGLSVNASYSLAANKTATFTQVTDPMRPLPQGGLASHQFLAMQG